MKPHFTYADRCHIDSLRQGDLLSRTKELDSVLENIHKYFLKKDYKYFLVLTQSCDLVRGRKGKACSADYITLAAVRSLDEVIQRESIKQSVQKEKFEIKGSICREGRKPVLIDTLRKIFNNNHKEYFFLNEDNLLGIKESCCAFLRISISLKSSEHYDKCLHAKMVELTEEFRAKLGWLVGDLYSRIGTQDWDSNHLSKKQFNAKIDDILTESFIWFPPEIVDALKKKILAEKIDVEILNEEEIKKMALEIHLPQKKDKMNVILDRIKEVLKSSKALAEDADIDRLLSMLGSDAVFRSKVK